MLNIKVIKIISSCLPLISTCQRITPRVP